MDQFVKESLWSQFGASIETLENTIIQCPEEVWSANRGGWWDFWYLASHTLFWLDYYLSETREGFVPQEPFGLEELDPAGVLPKRVYSKDELLKYLQHCRDKCRRVIRDMTDEKAKVLWTFGKRELTRLDLMMYNMRHVQHHSAQLIMILRQTVDSAPGWVFKAKDELI